MQKTNFWGNLTLLKDVLNLSFQEIADDLNMMVPSAGITKSILEYRMRYRKEEPPDGAVLDAVDELYCSGKGITGYGKDILHGRLTLDDAACLVTDGQIRECDHDRERWVRNFWESYGWMEHCFSRIGRAVPAWESAGKHSYPLRKEKRILPKRPVLEEMAHIMGLPSYPMLYLERMDDFHRIEAYAMITVPLLRYTSENDDAGRLLKAAVMMKVLTSEAGYLPSSEERKMIAETCRLLESRMKEHSLPTSWAETNDRR